MTNEERLAAFEEALASMRQDLDKAQNTIDNLRAEGKCKTATYQQMVSQRMLLERALRYFEMRGL